MVLQFATTTHIPPQREIKIETHLFVDDGVFPNNSRLKLLIYKQAFTGNIEPTPECIEETFLKNDWINSWRNGLYTMHHYHSSAHEVLGIYSGWVRVQFGGPQGNILRAQSGDVIVVPAGVSHKNIEQSPDFNVIGAYPRGQMWDMNYGKTGERPQADKRIQDVPLPKNDPVMGSKGQLLQFWK